ncbi:MAG: ATP-binding cassette domain-containing protein [Acidobacteria bacterium]|nr:ATP-binding cassette domain-containing protein [Acidobacteriota bacterium]
MPAEDCAVRFEKVTKRFGSQTVLDGVSFEVRQGSAFCLLGRSGTGKSVTLKHIIGLMKPDSGRVRVEGQDVSALSRRDLSRLRTRMGFLFQNAALFDSISVGDNVAFPIRRHAKLAVSDVRDRVRQKLEEVGLEREAGKMPSELSGGMRKRVGLARAMALDPSILLVDEPSAGLDPITAGEIDSLLSQLKSNRGTTLIIVTHNIPSARRLGDELAVLHGGHLIARGPAQELETSDHEVVRGFMRSEGGG